MCADGTVKLLILQNFFCNLFSDGATNPYNISLNDGMIVNKCKRKQSATSKYCSFICVEELRNHSNLSQDGWCPVRIGFIGAG
jgi:hypothetical protein